MHLPHYKLTTGISSSIFEFTSQGPKGEIPKIIIFSRLPRNNMFNLAFGDIDLQTGIFNDKTISGNLDSEKVLVTVVNALFLFFDENPHAIIYAKGSTKSRTRLYRMGISKYIQEIADDFQVFGERNGLWEEFQVNIDYYSFVIKRKSLKFDRNNN